MLDGSWEMYGHAFIKFDSTSSEIELLTIKFSSSQFTIIDENTIILQSRTVKHHIQFHLLTQTKLLLIITYPDETSETYILKKS